MSLSTHFRRISLNQWRYYYNQLLLIDVPLAATCIKGLMPLTEGSPTVQLQPIAADDTLPSEPSEPSSLIVKLLFLESLRCEALSAADCFSVDEWAFNELPLLPINCSCKQSCFEQATAVNIYADLILRGCAKREPREVVELIFTGQVGPMMANKLAFPEAWCRVSNLLAGFASS
ncbi:MAG: hypothetical protein AAF171_00260 [Cyanobacteria bacterium P01_A01_bin.116]